MAGAPTHHAPQVLPAHGHVARRTGKGGSKGVPGLEGWQELMEHKLLALGHRAEAGAGEAAVWDGVSKHPLVGAICLLLAAQLGPRLALRKLEAWEGAMARLGTGRLAQECNANPLGSQRNIPPLQTLRSCACWERPTVSKASQAAREKRPES